MSAGLMGAAAGFAFAVVNTVVTFAIVDRIESAWARQLVKAVALIDLVVFPAIGYFVGPMILG